MGEVESKTARSMRTQPLGGSGRGALQGESPEVRDLAFLLFVDGQANGLSCFSAALGPAEHFTHRRVV